MAGQGARRRDVLVLVALALVITGGLVHYGRDKLAEPTTRPAQVPATSPSAEATARLESAPPADPATAAPGPGKTCWDGREAASLLVCGLPEGTRGLEWVFPSFARDRASCHRAPGRADGYPVVASHECFQRVLGAPVTVVYDHARGLERVRRWLLGNLGARLGAEEVRLVPGPNGGRLVLAAGGRPARITGTYQRFPYVVSVYAPDRRTADHAWRTIVEHRAEDQIRGTVTG